MSHDTRRPAARSHLPPGHPVHQGGSTSPRRDAWPQLPRGEDWSETLETVHRWCQIVGKIRLACSPWINHGWHVPLYVSGRGLTTSPMYRGTRGFEIAFDFVSHELRVATVDGASHGFALEAMPVAAFYERVLEALEALDLPVTIWPQPVEIPGPVVAFPDDVEHAAYDPEPVRRFWLALVQAHRVLTDFRAGFIGKVSPVHFFWGAMDLAVTRFSGRGAPPHPGGAPNCADWVMRDAYSHEVSSAGFWPGMGLGEPAFYSYAYPEPPGFSSYPVRPDGAYYHPDLRELILPYEAVRTAPDPDLALRAFLDSAYEAAAELGRWDREALEAPELPLLGLHGERLARAQAAERAVEQGGGGADAGRPHI